MHQQRSSGRKKVCERTLVLPELRSPPATRRRSSLASDVQSGIKQSWNEPCGPTGQPPPSQFGRDAIDLFLGLDALWIVRVELSSSATISSGYSCEYGAGSEARGLLGSPPPVVIRGGNTDHPGMDMLCAAHHKFVSPGFASCPYRYPRGRRGRHMLLLGYLLER